MSQVRNPFVSLNTLRTTHRQLLERRRENGESLEFLAEVEDFIERARATGALLDARHDRWQAQNLLDYWANELYRVYQEAPDVTLLDFDPALDPQLADELCPYLGLNAFGTNKHTFFFGRNAVVEKMVDRLKYSRFLAIVGPSGSGKSSVALAGLLPRLQAGALQGSKTWRYYPPMVPGSNPQANLAHILQPPGAPAEWVHEAAEQLETDPSSLVRFINKSSSDPAVLFIDQFEEIFTFCQDDAKRRAFISALLHLIQTPKVRHIVILTMRTDLESHLVQVPALQAIYEQTQVRVSAMKASELREAIEKPAELVGLRFEEDLVDELIREVLGKPAALPLLQFTLLKLWENRDHTRVTWEAYRRLGGGRMALAKSADAFYDALTPNEQVIVRQLLLEILQPSVGQEITRDRVLRQTLYQLGAPQEQIDQVIERLLETGLVRLILGSSHEEDQVQIAHESLIRIWPRLAGWLEEERVAQRRRLRLATTTQQWEASGRDESLLLRGLLLEEAQLYNDLSQAEKAFVAASVAAADRARLEQEAARQRELEQARALAQAERVRAEESTRFARRLSLFAGALAVVFFLAVVAGLSAVRNSEIAEQNAATAVANEAVAEQLRVTAESSAARAVAARSTAQANADLRATAEADAREQRDAAEENAAEANSARATAVASAAEAQEARAAAEASALEARAQARLATARELAAAAIDQLNSDPQLGLLLALEAVNVTLDANQPTPAEAEDALYQALQTTQLQFNLAGHTDWVTDIAFSPDGTRLATASYDMSVKVWNATTGQELLTLADHSRAVNSVAFNADGTRLASSSDDGFVLVWDANTGQRLAVLNGENGTVRGLAFSPDGNLLAAANGDATVRVWDIDTRRSIFRLFGHTGALRGVAFSHDGAFLATAGEDGRVIVWDTATGAPVYSIRPEGNEENPVILNAVAFNPDGEHLATANNDGTARIWNFKTGEMVLTLSGHASAVLDVAYSPDGTRLITGSGDGTAKIWQSDTGQVLSTLLGHLSGVNAVTFSPNGERLATASQGGTAKIWNAESGIDVLTLSGHGASLLNLALDTTGTMVATAGVDGVAKVWDTATGAAIWSFADHNDVVRDVAFSPDGTLLATASADFNVRLWDMVTGMLYLPLLAHEGAVNSVVFSPDGTQLATAGDDGQVRIWETGRGQVVTRFEHTIPLNSVAFSADGSLLAASDDNGTTIVWDVAARAALLTLAGHEGPVNDVAFSADGTRLATAGGDGNTRMWDLTTGAALRTFSGHTGPVLGVAFSPDGTRLATASVDRTVKLWNTSTGQVLRTLLGHTSIVESVTFSPDGTRLATASLDGTAQLNDLISIGELFNRGLGHITRRLTREECEQYLRGASCVTESAALP